MPVSPFPVLKPKRKIVGMSAILLPYQANGEVDWRGFRVGILERTAAAGLLPAVNMDSGYVNLIDEATRRRVLSETQTLLGGESFIAGAFVKDSPGAALNADAYQVEIKQIEANGGMPIIFQSYGLTVLASTEIVDFYNLIARHSPRFLAFELGQMFAPFGRIYDLDTYAELLAIPQCVGAKHSSLSRELEWRRLALRDERRPDFLCLTGNDLAIDMVMYGCDYLLGLSTFAPEAFARRDALWLAGDPAFHELNDLLQYLGFFTFRPPVSDYKHSASQFFRLRGWIECDAPHPQGGRRPQSDTAVLDDILRRLVALCGAPA